MQSLLGSWTRYLWLDGCCTVCGEEETVAQIFLWLHTFHWYDGTAANTPETQALLLESPGRLGR